MLIEMHRLYLLCMPVIEVDLKAAHFKPGKANYERVKRCLSERLSQDVDFVLSWTGHGKLL